MALPSFWGTPTPPLHAVRRSVVAITVFHCARMNSTSATTALKAKSLRVLWDTIDLLVFCKRSDHHDDEKIKTMIVKFLVYLSMLFNLRISVAHWKVVFRKCIFTLINVEQMFLMNKL